MKLNAKPPLPSLQIFPSGLVGFAWNAYIYTTVHQYSNWDLEQATRRLNYSHSITEMGREVTDSVYGRSLVNEIFRRMRNCQ